MVSFKIESRSLRWEALLLYGLHWNHSSACGSVAFCLQSSGLVTHLGTSLRVHKIEPSEFYKTPPRSLSTAPPASITAFDSKQDLLKIALFARTFH